MWLSMWLHVYMNSTYTKTLCLALDKREAEMSDEEWAASLKAQCWTNCDYQL